MRPRKLLGLRRHGLEVVVVAVATAPLHLVRVRARVRVRVWVRVRLGSGFGLGLVLPYTSKGSGLRSPARHASTWLGVRVG